jgi:lipoprotein-anchoring transpeptidase ErfK/SrfK
MLNLIKTYKPIVTLLCALLGTVMLSGHIQTIEKQKDLADGFYLNYQVLKFAQQHQNEDVIVVSKKNHLLFYCRNGKIVRNDKWNGFTYNFPVKVALANKYHWTPEGEMYIDGKNPRSRYIRFLSFSGPGAYGIHSAATKFARYLDRMEKKDPNFEFATLKDDTRGCVQVENRVIKYLYANVNVNTPVLVMP